MDVQIISFPRMVIFSLIILLISNAITLSRDKSILNSRIVILPFIMGNMILVNNILVLPINFNICVCNNIFTVTWIHLFLQFISCNIFVYTFYNRSKKHNDLSLVTKFTSRLFCKSLNASYIITLLPKIQLVLSFLLPFSHLFDMNMCILPYAEGEKLNDDMHHALKQMLSSVHTLQKMKRLNNVKYISDEQGNLSIDVPNNMSDTEANNLSRRTGIADTVYNTYLERYKELLNKDETLNAKLASPGFDKSYQNILSSHRNLFEAEN